MLKKQDLKMGAATAVTVEQALADITYGGLAKIRGTVLAISVVQSWSRLARLVPKGRKRFIIQIH